MRTQILRRLTFDGSRNPLASKPKSGVGWIKRRALLCVQVLSIVVSVAGAGAAQVEGDSCPTDGVKVGFQGTICGIGNFFVSLNGEVATGTNTKCLNVVGGNFTFTSTNKAFVKLKPDQTYVVSSGTGICVNHINFDVPEDYVLYIDGVESNTIFKTNGGQSFSGDGSWNVVLRKKCPCSKEGIGEADSNVRSVVWEAGMGSLSDGRSAERISIREKMLSSFVYTPSALVYSKPAKTDEVEVIKNGDGSLRQVKAPQALADVVVINSSEYDVRYYRPADVGALAGGVYTVTGQPFVTWKIKNPEPANFTKLQILKIEGGTTTDKSEYVWDPLIDSWTLSTGWSPATGTYSRIESRVVSYPTTTSRRETFIVKESNGTVVSKTAKTYQTFP